MRERREHGLVVNDQSAHVGLARESWWRLPLVRRWPGRSLVEEHVADTPRMSAAERLGVLQLDTGTVEHIAFVHGAVGVTPGPGADSSAGGRRRCVAAPMFRNGVTSRRRNSDAPSVPLISAPMVAIASFTPSCTTRVGFGRQRSSTHSARGRLAGADEGEKAADQNVGGMPSSPSRSIGGARIAFLVVDVDDAVAFEQFGGHTAERQPAFAAIPSRRGMACSRPG